MRELWKRQGVGAGAGAGLDRYRVIQHLVREPWKSQEVRVGAGVGVDSYRVEGESAKTWPSDILKCSKSKMCRAIYFFWLFHEKLILKTTLPFSTYI